MRTKEIHVRREYLVRHVQEYTLEIPADLDPEEWLDGDLGAFDEAVCLDGQLTVEYDEPIDNDDLDVAITREEEPRED